MIVNGSSTPFTFHGKEGKETMKQEVKSCKPLHPFPFASGSIHSLPRHLPLGLSRLGQEQMGTVPWFLVPKLALWRTKAPINMFEVLRYPRLFKKEEWTQISRKGFFFPHLKPKSSVGNIGQLHCRCLPRMYQTLGSVCNTKQTQGTIARWPYTCENSSNTRYQQYQILVRTQNTGALGDYSESLVGPYEVHTLHVHWS